MAVDFYPEELRLLLREPGVVRVLVAMARPVVEKARSTAPRRSGAGAASIRAEAVLDGPEVLVKVSWDRDHYYMYMHERGTRYLPSRPFLVPALEHAPGE